MTPHGTCAPHHVESMSGFWHMGQNVTDVTCAVHLRGATDGYVCYAH